MKIIFGTTNKRKAEDLQNIINELNLNIEVMSMTDVDWDRGDIGECGQSFGELSDSELSDTYRYSALRKI